MGCGQNVLRFFKMLILVPRSFPKCAVAVGYVMVTTLWGTASRRVWNTPHTTMLRISTLHKTFAVKINIMNNNQCGENVGSFLF
jgi:hypothetical protein